MAKKKKDFSSRCICKLDDGFKKKRIVGDLIYNKYGSKKVSCQRESARQKSGKSTGKRKENKTNTSNRITQKVSLIFTDSFLKIFVDLQGLRFP